MDLRLRVDVDSLGGFIQEEDPGVRGEPFRQDDLLLVSSGEVADRLVVACELQLHPLQRLVHERQLEAPADDAQPGRPADHGQRGVVEDAEVLHDALAATILADIGDPGGEGLGRRAKGEHVAVEPDGAGLRLLYPEQDSRDLRAPAADEPRQADDLSPPEGEVNLLEVLAVAQPSDFKGRGADRRGPGWVDGRQLAAIGDLLESERIRPVIDKVFPFEQAKEALEYLALGRAKGKVVVRMQ